MPSTNELVYLLKEVNILSSGEKEFYVDVYQDIEKARIDMKEQIETHKEENGASIEWEDGDEVKLSDENANEYLFEIETAFIK